MVNLLTREGPMSAPRGIGTILLLTLGLATPAAAQALAQRAEKPSRSASVSLLDRPAKLEVRDAPLARALAELQNRSGVKLAFSPSLLSGASTVTCLCKDMTVGQALEHMLQGTVFRYAELAGQVLVERKVVRSSSLASESIEPTPSPALALMYTVKETIAAMPAPPTRVASVRNWAMSPRPHSDVAGSIRGRVVEAGSMRPLSGVQVYIPGSGRGALTDDAGVFVMVGVPAGTYTLRADMLGFAPIERSVTVQDNQVADVEFALTTTAIAFDEIVVTGTPGAVSKRTLGNAITTINAAEVTQKVTNATVTELLQAKATGVSVLPGGGTPGAGSSIRIRGTGSLVGNTSPVIYVDGVRVHSGAQGSFWNSWRSQRPGEPSAGAGQEAVALDMLNPEDIESIEVIKGPAAATLYGAEAANGVIQIITKKGRPGEQKLQWNAKTQFGQTDWAVDRVTNYTTCTQAVINARIDDGDGNPSNDPRRFPGCQGVSPGTLLQRTALDDPGVLRAGDLRNYALSVRGGGQGYSFFAAADRDEEQGVFENSTNERTALRANFAFFPSEKLDFSVNVGYNKTHTQFPINDDGYGVIQGAVLWRPGYAFNANDPNAACPTEGFAGPGPECVYEWWNNHLRADRMTLGATANYSPFPWLRNRLTVGLDQNERQADKYLPPRSTYGGAAGEASRATPQSTVYTLDYSATIANQLTDEVSSAFSFGTQYIVNQYRNTVATGNGFASGTIRQVALAASTSSYTDFIDQKSLGLYVQEQVGWRNRLYVTGAVRVDNNSAFGEDIDQLFFPKLSAAYVISDEPYFQDVQWVDQLKLRAAWGQAGNAPAPFSGQRTFTSGPTVDANGSRVPALRTDQFGNPDIKPERGEEIELGFDASFLENRLGVEFTYYNKTTKDAIMEVPVAPSSGFLGTRLENLGEIKNSGIELALRGTPLRHRYVTWDAALGLSTNDNELVSFGYERGPITLALYQPVQRHQPGFPLGAYWGNFPKRSASGGLEIDPATGALVPDTQVYIGPATPTRELSLSNTFTVLGNVRVFALLDYKGGHYVYNVKDQYRCWGGSFPTTWDTNAASNIPGACWEVNDPGASDDSKQIRQQNPAVNNGVFIQKADFMKLRDVSVTYTLPAAWAGRFGTNRAALTLAAHNLGFLWKGDYTGPDPEVNFTGVNDPGSYFSFIRVDSWTAPMTRRFSASLEVSF
jgi:TonB-linked SusC/RagA family outer membrane protein